MHTSICQNCGKRFDHIQKTRKFCSQTCSNRFNQPQDASKKKSYVCEWCGKNFIDWAYRNCKFCSNQCRTEYASRCPKPSQRRPQNFINIVCSVCGKIFSAHKAQSEKKYPMKYCSDNCKYSAISVNMRADKNPNYTGGTIKGRGPNWSRQARKARRRDNYTCQICGRNGKIEKFPVEVHHKTPYRKFNGDFEKANDLSNLISVCRQCHVKIEPRH